MMGGLMYLSIVDLKTLKAKNLLLVRLNALSIMLNNAFYWIPITMTETRDTLYFSSERNTTNVLTVLLYRLKLLAQVISPKIIELVSQTAL